MNSPSEGLRMIAGARTKGTGFLRQAVIIITLPGTIAPPAVGPPTWSVLNLLMIPHLKKKSVPKYHPLQFFNQYYDDSSYQVVQ